MENQKTIKEILIDISQSISELEKEKNLGKIVKQYNKIDGDIKNIFAVIYELQNKIRSLENIESNTNLNNEIVDDIQYEEYEKELSNDQIDKIINSDNLEMQIEHFKILMGKLNSCKMYLENKKILVIECDKELTKETKNKKEIKNKKENKKEDITIKKTKSSNKKTKSKKYISSSSSSSNSNNSHSDSD